MKKSLPTWAWELVAMAGVLIIGLIDWLTGFELNFFVFYFLPVSIAAWYVGQAGSVWIAVFSAFVWFTADALSGHVHSLHFYAVWNTMVRLVSFIVIGASLSKIRLMLDRERKLHEDLQQSISQVKVLESFLPICCECKKIRDDEGHWQQLEKYISEHTNSRFSHGYCPECAKKVMIEAGIIKK
jgi:hypothetical protein